MPNIEPQLNVPLMPGPMLPYGAMAPNPAVSYRDRNAPRSVEDEVIEIDWETETDRMKVTSSVPDGLLKILGGKWSATPDITFTPPDLETAANDTSPSALEKMESDVEKAHNKCLKKLVVPRGRLVPLVYEMAKVWPKSSIQLSGMFLYPKGGGYMGWHTNSDSPCTRVYISNVKEGGKSFFRYRLDGEYVTSWDRAGWNMRAFEVTKDNPMWHCVYAEEDRLSVGFRINKNLL